MTLDKLVTTDLAALAVDSRRPRAFEATLRAIGVVREPRRDATAEPALLSLCRVFAHRVALRSAGAAALVCATGLLALLALADPLSHDWDPGWYLGWYLAHNIEAWAASIFVVVATVYFAGYCLGASHFEQRLRASGEPERRARLEVQHPDAWGVGLAIAGATVLVTVLGSQWFNIGSWPIIIACYEMYEASANCIRAVAIAIGLVMIGSVVIGHATARGRRLRWLQHPSVGSLGIVLGLLTLLIGFRLDVGPLLSEGGLREPSYILRGMLMLSGTLSVFLVVAGIVLRRAARSEPLAAANGVGLALCRTYAHRFARVIAGSVMLAGIAGILVMLAVASTQGWPWYLAHGVGPWASSVLVLTALIYFASYCVGAKRFERSVAAAAEPERTARQLAQRLDAWAVALAIAGATGFAIVFGSLWFTIGSLGLDAAVLDPESRASPITLYWLYEIAIALALVMLAAFAIGRAAAGGRRNALLEHPGVIALGVAVGLVTLYLGFRFDVLPLLPIMQGATGLGEPSIVLRGVLVFSGTLAVFLVVAGVTLRRRRRELD